MARNADIGRWPGILLGGLLGGSAQAQDWARDLWDGMQIHGFLSQGYVKTSDNRWYGDSDQGSWDLRELGVNLSLQPASRLQVAAQVLSRAAGEMDDGQPRLDYALVDWAAWIRGGDRVGLRLGRIKNPLGFYNETRDVAFTRPGIFLPQSVYFDRVHDMMLSADGMQFYGDGRWGSGDLSARLGFGYLPLDDNAEYAFLGRDWQGEFGQRGPFWVAQIGYELDSGLRLALSGALGTLDFSRGAQDPPPPLLESGEIDYRLGIASLQYNAERWSLTAEYLTQVVDWLDLGTLMPDRHPGQGYYLQADYRLDVPVELFLRYGARYLNTDDKSGSQAAEQRGVPAHTQYAKEWAVGLRWDPDPAWMVRAEYQRVDGTAWLSNQENRSQDTERNWDLFALEISFRF